MGSSQVRPCRQTSIGSSNTSARVIRYRRLRHEIRAYYFQHFPVTPEARAARWFNPGNHECSTLACEPRASLAALTQMLAPYVHSGRLRVYPDYRLVSASSHGDRITSVVVGNALTGDALELVGKYYLDATELGDLLPAAGVEHVIGAEPQEVTEEPHAIPGGNERCQMAITWCYAIDYIEAADFTIDRPRDYEFYRDAVPAHWPNPQLSFTALDWDTMGPWHHTFLPVKSDGPIWESLWTHRRTIDKTNFAAGTYESDILHVNWTQNDYFWGPIVGVSDEERARHLDGARELSLSWLYWLQTEAPRQDGGNGFPGLRLRSDVVGTRDGLAMYPYIREARRIRAQYTMGEQDISAEARKDGATTFDDAVAVGYYFLDMHQRTEDAVPFYTQTWPFQIPLGALIPERVRNLIPACKNLGVTHVVNSATRLHPVEWVIGEAAGTLGAFCVERATEPAAVRADQSLLAELQARLVEQGVEISWPRIGPVRTWDEHLLYTVKPAAVNV